MIKIYSTSWCPSCVAAKRFLKEKKIEFEEINIEEEGISREQLYEIAGGMSVPQILVNNKSIGGFNELFELNQSGKLEEILNSWSLFLKKY